MTYLSHINAHDVLGYSRWETVFGMTQEMSITGCVGLISLRRTTMTTLEQAAQMALEALETVIADVKTTPTAYEAQRQAAEALRQALDHIANVSNMVEHPKQEPEAWTWDTKNQRDGFLDAHFQFSKPESHSLIMNLRPLYTEPPKRKSLTDELYNELLFAVASKYPDETRHQTALRYIRRAEMRSASPEKATHRIKEQP
ncbi:hypothetical protein UFOVP116_214 [uncultured Caudovirales phage]|uniref:Uncharacterized protein n=1 Tax=uncultured Caudovirales phage TaxID=2100421 RepID=A0A6J5LEC2_9CAUD|nr:hypothetical protein UFOVP116_214 [uncultured Caudovirales phage]